MAVDLQDVLLLRPHRLLDEEMAVEKIDAQLAVPDALVHDDLLVVAADPLRQLHSNDHLKSRGTTFKAVVQGVQDDLRLVVGQRVLPLGPEQQLAQVGGEDVGNLVRIPTSA